MHLAGSWSHTRSRVCNAKRRRGPRKKTKAGAMPRLVPPTAPSAPSERGLSHPSSEAGGHQGGWRVFEKQSLGNHVTGDRQRQKGAKSITVLNSGMKRERMDEGGTIGPEDTQWWGVCVCARESVCV